MQQAKKEYGQNNKIAYTRQIPIKKLKTGFLSRLDSEEVCVFLHSAIQKESTSS